MTECINLPNAETQLLGDTKYIVRFFYNAECDGVADKVRRLLKEEVAAKVV